MPPKKVVKKTNKTDDVDYKNNQCSVGLQTIYIDNAYVSPRISSLHNIEHKEFAPIFYKPHTLISLGIFLLGLFYFATNDEAENKSKSTINLDAEAVAAFGEQVTDDTTDETQATRKAFIGAFAACLAFGMIYMPGTLMVRPHPIFWRFCLCL